MSHERIDATVLPLRPDGARAGDAVSATAERTARLAAVAGRDRAILRRRAEELLATGVSRAVAMRALRDDGWPVDAILIEVARARKLLPRRCPYCRQLLEEGAAR